MTAAHMAGTALGERDDLDRLAAALGALPADSADVSLWARCAHRLLAEQPRRLEHVLGMWRRTRRWEADGLVDGDLARSLHVAVLAHDLGYAVDAARHAQVAARALQLAGAPDPVVSAVAHHSRSKELARRRGLSRDYRGLPECGGLLDDAMTLLDVTTGPDGQPLALRARWADIAQRYGAHSVEANEALACRPQIDAAAAALGIPPDPPCERTLLVCDLGGVLTSGDGAAALADAAGALGADRDAVLTRWRGSVRTRFWDGELGVTAAARELAGGTGIDTDALARAWDAGMSRDVAPLPDAARHLEELSVLAPVWVLSNHRTEWLAGVRSSLGWLVGRWLVSDRTGAVKPAPQAFEHVERAWRARCSLDGQPMGATRLVYVDDQDRNLTAAAARGWYVVEGTGGWPQRAAALLQ